MTRSGVRTRFPYLASGRIYLNHAGVSPWSTYVVEEIDAIVREHHMEEIDIHASLDALKEETRAMCADLVGCAPERIAFMPNTSDGLNVIANGLRWKSGDRIVLVDREFPANVHPFVNLRRHGVEIDFVDQRDGIVRLEDIEAKFTPRTRLASVSWVQFLSGYRIDLTEFADLCRRYDVVSCVDAIQGLGAVRLDVRSAPVDAFSAGGHKWLMAPLGTGILYVSEILHERLEPAYAGWLGVREPWDFFAYDQPRAGGARRYETGAVNVLGLGGLHGSLRLGREIGFDRIEAFVLEASAHAIHVLRSAGWNVVTPEDPAHRAGIVSVRHPAAERTVATLLGRNICVAAREGHIRLSPHYYNSPEEIDAAVEHMTSLRG